MRIMTMKENATKKQTSARRGIKRPLIALLKNPLVYVVIAFIALMVVLIDIVWRYEAGVTMEHYGDSVWNFLIAFVAGYYDICVVTPVGRFCSFIILLSGILLFSTITGKIAAIFMEIQMKKDKGLKQLTNLKNHFLLCGWRPGFEKILEGILDANPEIPAEKIVIVNEADVSAIEALRTNAKLKPIKFLHGDFTDENTLLKAQVKTADRVLIFADKSAPFSTLETDSRTVLAVITIKNLNPRIYCVAELIEAKFAKHLSIAHCDEIIMTSSYEQNLLVQASSGQGMSHILNALATEHDSSGLVLRSIPAEFVGGSYEKYKHALKTDDILIGILENTGNFYVRRNEALAEAQKNPNMGKIVANLKKVKTLKSNVPVFNPPDAYVIPESSKAIFVRRKNEQLSV